MMDYQCLHIYNCNVHKYFLTGFLTRDSILSTDRITMGIIGYYNLSYYCVYARKIDLCRGIRTITIILLLHFMGISKPTSSLCIPRMDSSVPKEYICKKITDMNAGYVQRITEIPLRNDPTQKRIIIKLAWNNNMQSVRIQQQLSDLGSIKLVHDMPWFWKIVATHPRI